MTGYASGKIWVMCVLYLRCGPAPAFKGLPAFEAFALRQSGSTLEQMSRAWEEETGRHLSRNTFSLALHKLGWTRKKELPLPGAEPPRTPEVSRAIEPHRARRSGLC